MLEPQNDHFVRDFLQFSHFVASKSTFSYEFSHEPQNLRPQNRCFARSFRQFSAHLSKCHARHPICTSSPLHEALTMRFAKNTQHDTSKVLQPPRKMMMEVPKVLRKTQLIFLKRRKSIAPATQNDFQHVMKPYLTVTKCHACHSKRGYAALETSKSDHFCRTRHGHGHTGLTRPPVDGCGCKGLRNVERTHLNPQTPRVKREPLLRIREKHIPRHSLDFPLSAPSDRAASAALKTRLGGRSTKCQRNTHASRIFCTADLSPPWRPWGREYTIAEQTPDRWSDLLV